MLKEYYKGKGKRFDADFFKELDAYAAEMRKTKQTETDIKEEENEEND